MGFRKVEDVIHNLINCFEFERAHPPFAAQAAGSGVDRTDSAGAPPRRGPRSPGRRSNRTSSARLPRDSVSFLKRLDWLMKPSACNRIPRKIWLAFHAPVTSTDRK